MLPVGGGFVPGQRDVAPLGLSTVSLLLLVPGPVSQTGPLAVAASSWLER